MNTTFILSIFSILITFNLAAQEVQVDASKPTNLYTQINTVLEYQIHNSGSDVYGTRINVQYTFNPDNLLLLEFPLLYNSGTDKFGLADVRVRYFYVAKRNMSKSFIALAPFVDVSIPTGRFEDGLGSSSWSLTGGFVVGIVLSPKMAIFPGVGYVHITEPTGYIGHSKNGVNIQSNLSVKFTDKAFMFINPTVTILDKVSWSGEFNFNYMVKPNKLKFNVGYFPLFTQNIHVIRAGASFYL